MFRMMIKNNINKLLRKKFDSSFFENFSYLSNKIKIEDFEYFVNEFLNHTNFPRVLNNTYFNKKNFSLTSMSLGLNDIDKEIIWFTQYFLKNIDKINNFIQLKNEIDKSILFSDYSKALKDIDEIEKNITISYWSIETYANISKEIMNKSANSILNKIKNGIKDDNLTYFFINQILIKSETKNIMSFIDNLVDTLEKLRIHTKDKRFLDMADLFSSYFIPIEFDKNRDIDGRGLSCITTLTIIDQFLLFKNYLLDKILFGKSFTENQLKYIYAFIEKIEDKDLKNVMIPITSITEINPKSRNLVKEYTLGNYNHVINEFEKNILSDTYSITCIDLYIKSLIYEKRKIKGNNILKFLTNNLINIYLSNDNTSLSIKQIENLSLKFNFSSWTISFLFFLYKFINSPNIKFDTKSKRMSIFGENVTPIVFSNEYSYNSLIKELGIINISDIPIYRQEKFEIKKFEEEFTLNNDYYAKYSDEMIIKADYIKMNANFLLKKKEIDTCIEFIIDMYLENNNRYIFLPIQKIISSIDIDNLEFISINLPIIYDIYRKNISLEKEEDLGTIFLRYMRKNKTHKPSTIFGSRNELSEKEIYFLKYVCIPSIMDSSSKFDELTDLLNERLEILKILDKFNVEKSYIEKERNSIYEEISAEELKASYNMGRIFVDTKKMYQIKSHSYKKLFDLYIVIISNSKDNDENNEGYLAYDATKNLTDNKSNFIPLTDETNLITEIYKEYLINDFVKNQNFGFEKYLSAEIRHGNMRTELRCSIEKYNLLTDANEIFEYADNNYWLNYYKYLDIKIKKNINDSLKNFSKKIDFKLNEAEEQLQIVTEVDGIKNNKLDFTAEIERLHELSTVLNGVNDFDDFFDRLIKFMWKITDKVTLDYQSKLEHNLKNDISIIFDELHEIIEKDKIMHSLYDLSNEINKARNNFFEEINHVSKWFNRVEGNIDKLYSLKSIIKTSEQIFKKIASLKSEITIKSESRESSSSVELTYLEARAFMTSMLIALYNANEHGNNKLSKNYILIDLEEFVDSHVVIIKNEIDIVENEIDDFLSKLRENFSDEKSELSTSEGGTGLHKIYNLFNNVSSKFYVKIDIEDKSKFCIYLGVNYENISN
jgi:hypothetical protein